MSYRLIDSNAIAIKYPEVNEMPCVFADLPDGLNEQFIDAQPEPLQVARDIATIIENERDMRAILSQPEPHWIPCSERLPNDEDIYLVAVDKNSLTEDDVSVLDAYWLNGKWQYAMIENYEHKMPKLVIEPIEELKIIAWMPLPEPWEGEE